MYASVMNIHHVTVLKGLAPMVLLFSHLRIHLQSCPKAVGYSRYQYSSDVGVDTQLSVHHGSTIEVVYRILALVRH
jgi:hypothetical protein